MYVNPALEKYAHVLLPMAPFTETAGTFINAAGEWQSFHGVGAADGDARPAWKILRVLGNFLQLDGFAYESAQAIKEEIKQYTHAVTISDLPKFTSSAARTSQLYRIGEIPLYAVDSLVRHAQPLQTAQGMIEGDVATVRVHPETATKLKLTSGQPVSIHQQGGKISLPVLVDERIAPDAVWVAGGIPATSGLGDLFGEIDIQAENKS
jgi:NADH-quinone oxidoreductase subunit G